jgi:hypothetical protein
MRSKTTKPNERAPSAKPAGASATTNSPSSKALSGSKAPKLENLAGDYLRADDLDRAPEPLEEEEAEFWIALPLGALSFA